MPIKKVFPLKVKRNPSDRTWRYSFRTPSMVLNTGFAGPAAFTEAQAYRKAYIECYGYEPDVKDYPPGVLDENDIQVQQMQRQQQLRQQVQSRPVEPQLSEAARNNTNNDFVDYDDEDFGEGFDDGFDEEHELDDMAYDDLDFVEIDDPDLDL